MTKVFISQPMKGKTEEEILKERNEAMTLATQLLEGKVKVLDSYFQDYNPQTGSIPLKYLSKSIELLADANLLVCTRGWEEARGCIIEHECAKAYGITILYLEGN